AWCDHCWCYNDINWLVRNWSNYRKTIYNRCHGCLYVFIRINIDSNFFAGNAWYSFWRCRRGPNKITCCGVRNFIALIVMIISIKSPVKIRSYALLIGIVMGWIIYRLIFGNEDAVYSANTSISLFPLGSLHWNTGVIITTVVAGIL